MTPHWSNLKSSLVVKKLLTKEFGSVRQPMLSHSHAPAWERFWSELNRCIPTLERGNEGNSNGLLRPTGRKRHREVLGGVWSVSGWQRYAEVGFGKAG